LKKITVELKHMNKKLAVGFFSVFLILSAINIASAQLTVGVKKGDWIQYQVSFTGTPEPNHDIVAAKMEVLDVQGTAIYVNIVSTYSNGTQVSTNSTLNLQTGQLIDNFIIPANLTTGDKFYSSNVGNITIAGIEQRTYAGATRTAVNATSGGTTYIWDQATGISVEGISVGSDFTMHTLANATNIWQPQSPGLNMTIVYSLVIVAVIVIVAVVVLVARRKK
jgi:hypothetical protein